MTTGEIKESITEYSNLLNQRGIEGDAVGKLGIGERKGGW